MMNKPKITIRPSRETGFRVDGKHYDWDKIEYVKLRGSCMDNIHDWIESVMRETYVWWVKCIMRIMLFIIIAILIYVIVRGVL